RLELDYEMVAYPSVSEALVSLETGNIDIVLGSVTVTSERLEKFDFTQPIVQEELTLLLPSAPPTLWSFIRPFLGWAFISSAGLIYVCLFLIGNLLWLAEHKENPQQFSPKYFKGVREGMWCATTTFTTVGYGDRYPITPLGRIIAGCWSIISIVIISSLTAGIATTLTLAFSPRSAMEFYRPQDLKNARIAVIKGSNAIRWANHYQARVSPVKNLSTALAQLDNQQVDAILYSRLILEDHLYENPQLPYRIANFSLGRENYSIALTQNNPLTKQLNKQLLDIDMQIRFQKIRDNWLEVK
ncbi:MAG: transporter substrate-binding domain-containing protein, partial [Microcystaceae cyanobacterium]